jgi:hypothetical protein
MNDSQNRNGGTFKASVENENSFNSFKNRNDFSEYKDSMKSLFAPFIDFTANGGSSNPFEKMFKQVTDYNKHLFGAFTKQFEQVMPELNTLSEKLQHKAEKQFEASKSLTNTIVETFTKQMESSLDVGKKLQEEMSKQITSAIKLNQEFCSEASTTSARSSATSMGNFAKDGAANENKKPMKVNG